MNAFTSAKQVEADAFQILRPLIFRWADNGQFILTDKGPMAKLLQEIVGDLAMNIKGDVISVELKAEATAGRNFFFEEWSNYPDDESASPNPGWARKTNATFIWYFFLDTQDLWIFRRKALQQWLYGKRQVNEGFADTIVGGAVYETSNGFRQRVQGKRDQLNVTTGFCVPISFVASSVPHKHIRVRELLAAEHVS